MSKNKDALKFFQAYVNEMIDVGGLNLPKSISVSLGAKLGKLLRERGVIGIENSLRKIYKTLKAKTTITAGDDDTYEISLKYSKKFCPIGGKLNPERAKVIQDAICVPYTSSILNSLHPNLKFYPEFRECILNSNEKTCQYHLEIKDKKST
ncbi:MAG: hypothetical protein ACW98D_07770 [Promethearchaeota archaeon]|jgi:hypothetical protein